MSHAVLLVSHGSVDDLDDLGAFVTNVRRGQPPSADLISELRRRYEAIGGTSPLNAITAETARRLEARIGIRVAWANRLWKPYVRERLADLCAEGVRQVALIPLAPHSAHVYADDARRAAEGLAIDLTCADNWGNSSDLHAAFASRIVGAIDVPAAHGVPTTLVMTAHSLPKAVVDRGDPYEREVRGAAAAIATLVETRLGRAIRKTVAFQSQGIAKGGGSDRSAEWLGPNLEAVIDDAAAFGGRVVFAPVGFLADHVEILYDLDLEARRMATDRGLAYARAASLNADDDLVDVLAQVARPLTHHVGRT